MRPPTDNINELIGNRCRASGGWAPSSPLLGAIPLPGASQTGFDSDSLAGSSKRQDQAASNSTSQPPDSENTLLDGVKRIWGGAIS